MSAAAASIRGSPSFCVGGVAWLGPDGEAADIVPAAGGWLCFHCNERFATVRSALRHFGNPAAQRDTLCILQTRTKTENDGSGSDCWRTIECERALYVDRGKNVILCDRLPSGPVTLVVRLRGGQLSKMEREQ